MLDTPRRAGSAGLPVFHAHELTAIRLTGYKAILVLDVGGEISFGISHDPNRYVRNVASKAKRQTKVLGISWAPDEKLARRVKDQIHALLRDRRIPDSDHFDVPERLALGAVDVAASKVGPKLVSTDEMLGRWDVERVRWLARRGRLLDTDRHLG